MKDKGDGSHSFHLSISQSCLFTRRTQLVSVNIFYEDSIFIDLL